MNRDIPIQEDYEISCRVLAHLLSREIDSVERNYFFRDFQTKSRDLRVDVRKRLTMSVMSSFLPSKSDDIISMFKEISVSEKKDVDILIVTIKQKELLGSQIAFGINPLNDKEAYRIDGFRFWKKSITTKSEGKVKIALTMVGRDRTVNCAVACSKFFNNMNVGLCVLVGICAGLQEKVTLGDSICAEMVLDYEGGRQTEENFEKRPEPYPLDIIITHDMSHFNPNLGNWQKSFRKCIKDLAKIEDIPDIAVKLKPKYHTGVILSGEKLLVDGKLPEMRKEYHERVRGAEMEGSGFANACRAYRVPWLVFRGVSDYGDPNKPEMKIWKTTAAISASTAVMDFIKRDFRKPETQKF